MSCFGYHWIDDATVESTEGKVSYDEFIEWFKESYERTFHMRPNANILDELNNVGSVSVENHLWFCN